MVRTRKEKKTDNGIKLKQPDRSGPTEATLLQLAQERNLFEEADRKQGKRPGLKKNEDAVIPPTVDRIMEAVLWGISLTMLHFAFDVLIQRQYAMELSYPKIAMRTLQASFGKLYLTRGEFLRPTVTSVLLTDFLPISIPYTSLLPPSTFVLAYPTSRAPA